MSSAWDPARYLAFADERSRPFVDLIARIPDGDPDARPARVVDLGCGPGHLTAQLTARWPDASVLGVDSSAAMIERAEAEAVGPGVDFELADLRAWLVEAPPGQVDVLVSNATLQWVPDHLDLLPSLVAAIRPGGVFAIQVPGNFAEPSHAILEQLAAQPRYRDHTAAAPRPWAHDAVTYGRALRALGCEVDAWETTYLHVLRGRNPVFTWVSATGARPVLDALPDELRPGFEAAYRARLRGAYPAEADGSVVFGFRRVFVVARTPRARREDGR